MDALKLLSRSTGLKIRAQSPDGRRRLPSEGQVPTSTLDPLTLGRKRKRDTDDAQNGGFGNGDTTAFALRGDPGPEQVGVIHGEVTSDGFSVSSPIMNNEECSRILKQHKVKVVDLCALNKLDGKQARKVHKEKYHLFPQPLSSFTMLRSKYNISKALAENIAQQGYSEPTEVQLATIPLLFGEQGVEADLLTVAPTGSGKTLAFLIPLIEKICQSHRRSGLTLGSRQVSAIILAPTKELVAQIVSEGKKLTDRTGVSITAMQKSMRLHDVTGRDPGQSQSIGCDGDEARGGTSAFLVKKDIIVSTPMLLANSLFNSEDSSSATLPHITTLVLDEADVLLDPLFRPQTLAVWNACTNSNVRVSLWSATIGSSIESLATSIITERHLSLSPSISSAPLLRCVVGLKDTALPTITHKLIYAATEQGKLLGLRQLLHPSSSMDGTQPKTPPLRPPFLVFTQTIQRAIALHSELLYDIPPAAGGSTRVAVLHSDLSDSQRSDVMARFRKGQIWVLITTDLLSRGVDFRGVNGVVNYDIPTTSAAYVHRVGRTGRAGRQGGIAVTFFTKEDVSYVKGVANMIALSERTRRKAGALQSPSEEKSGIQQWMLDALPDISKKDRKELKKHGVDVRRSISEKDDAKAVRAKRKSKISTKSGYERRLEHNRKGAADGGRRRKKAAESSEEDEWGGLSD